jgi:hypothetical protein
VDAYEAGLWLFWVTAEAVICCPRPALQLVGDRLHCIDGPAVAWPDGDHYYFWRGVQVPEKVVLRPFDLTTREVLGEPNAEVRRVMMERYGPARLLLDGGAVERGRDACGVLYHLPLQGDEDLVMVKVRNSTPEPDGSTRDYYLRVPPSMRTAREAVAWTFGLTPNEYRPVRET